MILTRSASLRRNISDLKTEHIQMRSILIETAKSSKGLIYYSDLIRMTNLDFDLNNPNDRGRLGQMLGDISNIEVIEGRPMLSSLVISKSLSMPSDGFFLLAEELYHKKSIVKDDESKINFWNKEREATIQYWKNK